MKYCCSALTWINLKNFMLHESQAKKKKSRDSIYMEVQNSGICWRPSTLASVLGAGVDEWTGTGKGLVVTTGLLSEVMKMF